MPSVSVIPHGNGYRCVWREGGRGSKRHWSETKESKREATVDAEVIRARLLAAQPLKAARVRLSWAEVAQRWHDSRPPGRYRTEGLADLHVLAWKSTEDATPDAVSKLKLGLRRLVNSALRYARVNLKQRVDPDVGDLPLPRSSRPTKEEPALLTPKEIDALVREAATWSPGNGVLAHLCATYGHRAASLVGLTGEAIDLRAGTISLPVKGGGRVTHELHPVSLAMLKALGPRAGVPLFINHLGVPWRTGKMFAEWFYHRCGVTALGKGKTPGRKVGYYQAKSAAITAMLKETGNDAKTVASITGHKRPSLLLDVYARTNAKLQAKALRGARPAGAPRKQGQVSAKKKGKRL